MLWARYYLIEEDYAATQSSAEQALQHASDPEQPMALIAIHRFLGELAVTENDLTNADMHLRQSLERAEKSAIPFERALTILAQAELEFVRDNARGARDLLTEARRICTDLGARPTLERLEQLVSRLPAISGDTHHGLSPREVDVLELIVRGMSDKEIADHLFISHHTVMRHVSHILAKLGVDSRTAAAATAVRDGIC